MSKRCSIVYFLRRLVCGPPRIDFCLSIPTTKGIASMLTFQITTEQKIKVALEPKTAAGNPAPVDGAPAWSVISGDATVEPAEDGLSAYLISSDTPSTSEIRVSADADIGEGIETIEDVIILQTVSAKATKLGLMSVGVPELKNPPPA